MNIETKTITKKELREVLTSNRSAFLGVTNHYIEADAVLNTINEILVNKVLLNIRSATVQGKYITFTDGSSLDVNDNKFNKYTCEKMRFENAEVLVIKNKWFDAFEEKWCEKYIYYFVM